MQQSQPSDEQTSQFIEGFLNGFLPVMDQELSKRFAEAINNDGSMIPLLDELKDFDVIGKFLNLVFMKILFSPKGVQWLQKHYTEMIEWIRRKQS